MASSIKLSYHRRLFAWLVVYSVVLVSCFAVFQYLREKDFKAEEINLRLQHINESLLDDLTATGEVAVPRVFGAEGFDELRVSIIDSDGRVVFDNSLDRLPDVNHLDRREIADAVKNGSAYTIRRHSASTGLNYFYSARSNGEYTVRTAVPYDVNLNRLLAADIGFLWFMVGITVAMCILGYFATRRVGQHISRLNSFASKAERGERIYDTDTFPHDELGEISNHIVRLYARLQQAMADRDREHKAAMREEQEKIEMKRRLTNNINHELKTPVAAMQVCLETLTTHPGLSEERRNDFIRRCADSCERLRRLLDDVSQITRLEDGASNIALEPLNLRETVAAVCDELRDAAADKGISINVSVDEDIEIEGNAGFIDSIFRNLIANAINYSGGSEVEVIAVDDGGDFIGITVADNGTGVAEEHLPRLFERFYRVDKGRSRQAGGTGLGLAIVKNAVLFHGGHISVMCRRNGGLVFDFTLPKSDRR